MENHLNNKAESSEASNGIQGTKTAGHDSIVLLPGQIVVNESDLLKWKAIIDTLKATVQEQRKDIQTLLDFPKNFGVNFGEGFSPTKLMMKLGGIINSPEKHKEKFTGYIEVATKYNTIPNGQEPKQLGTAESTGTENSGS